MQRKGTDGGQEELNKQIVEKIKEYKKLKAEYIAIMDEKLYDKWEINEANGRAEGDSTIKYAFVTFRSTKGKKKAMTIFKYAQEFAPKGRKSVDLKMFFGKYLQVKNSPSPSNIKWENI